MNASAQAGTTSPLSDSLRSDLLPSLVGLARSIKAFSPLVRDFVVFHVVLDANKAQGELRWRLGRRRNPAARTGLYEAIVAGVIIAYAPACIEDEILEHAADIAADTGSTVEDVNREWNLLRPCLHLYPNSHAPAHVTHLVDPDDLPYIAARDALGVRAIYTDDYHLRQMGAPVVLDRIDGFLRDYARANTVKIGISLGSSTAFSVSIQMIPALYRVSRQPLHGCAVSRP